MGEVYGYSKRSIGRDLALIGSVGVALILFHFLLSPVTRARLAFDHGSLDVVSLYSSAFVHFDASHLLGNVSGYVATTVVAYGLCLKADRRRWFHLTFAGFLLGLPALVSLTSYAVLGWLYPAITPITRGFSGVGAGFTAFVLLALLISLRTKHGLMTALYVGVAVWLWLLLEVFLIYGGESLPVAVAITVTGWGFSGWGLIDEHSGSEPIDGLARESESVLTVLLVVLLLTLFVYILFPSEPVSDGTVTNVFAHAAGFGYGLLGAGTTYYLTAS
ncbi:hypothetical protein [Halorientalis salina]|uniref:hypothetical protein n=1 Tax=Halorientalis salina TaxID=2932266 RepID=UPI0010ABB842|nr:hypothetical protein [Halorientalis salina]